MVRATVKTVTYGSNRRKYTASRQAVARAANLLRARVATTTRAPLRTGGFYGVYNRRGREELKLIDKEATATTFLAAGAVTLLNGIAQGTDNTDRIGRKTILKSILFRISVFPSATAPAATGDVVRVMLVYDCQTNAAAPAVTDIISAGFYDNPMNLNNRDRFKILADKFITMSANNYAAAALTAGSPTAKHLKIYKKMSMDQIFAGTAATVGSISTGGIFLLTISKGNLISTYDYDSRIRFIDA